MVRYYNQHVGVISSKCLEDHVMFTLPSTLDS